MRLEHAAVRKIVDCHAPRSGPAGLVSELLIGASSLISD
jgi:hypothetical protein